MTVAYSVLLDSEYTQLGHIRVAVNTDGVTDVGEIDAAGQAIVNKKIMTLGELHRNGQLRPAQAVHPDTERP